MLPEALTAAVQWSVPVILAALVAWAGVKRKKLAEWRAEHKAHNEGLRALVAGYPESRAKQDATADAVGKMSGQFKVVNATLEAQNRVLGLLQARSQSIYEASDRAEFECDSDGRNESVNAMYAEMLGVDKDELLGFRWRSFIPAEHLQPYLQRFQLAAADHRKFDDEITMRRSDGVLIRVRVHMIPYPPDQGPATHWTGVLTPIEVKA